MKARILSMFVLATCFFGSSAWADILRLEPSQIRVLPVDQTGITRVAMQFDFGGLRSGEGRVIDAATVDWQPDGIPTEEMTSYSLSEITGNWSEQMDDQALAGLSIAEQPSDLWELEPADIARVGVAHVRFDITDLVRGWTAEGRANHGVVFTVPSLGKEAAEASFGKMKLVVLYAFKR